MTYAAIAFPTVLRPTTSPMTWSGRILSGAIGVFLASEGVSRLVWARALVAPSEAAPTLEPSLQIPLGATLLMGAVLQATRPARLFGAVVLLLCLAALIAVEAAADVRSPLHMLFWAYVGGLLVAGAALRRASVS